MKTRNMLFLLVCSLLKIYIGTAAISESLNQDVDLRVDVSDDHISNDFKRALVNATFSNDPWMNQYSPDDGIERLRRAIAKLYSKQIRRELNADQHILVTVGATEAVYSALEAFTSPGDEWIVIEPFWSKYKHMLKLVGGIPRYTNLKMTKKFSTLSGEDWILNTRELESLFNNKTKGILFNNPNNPSGKVYSLGDLLFIAQLAKKYNTLVISDEVHEWAVYRPYVHVNIASLPGMFNRTITIGSASKAFFVSGWRIGWAYGPEHLLNELKNVHSNIVQGSPTPIQEAVAYALEKEIRDYKKDFSFFHQNMEKSMLKRNIIVNAFKKLGMSPVIPNGGYCMIAFFPQFKYDVNNTLINIDKVNKVLKVRGFPMTNYYSNEHAYLGKNCARYCFHKSNKTLTKAIENMLQLNKTNLVLLLLKS